MSKVSFYKCSICQKVVEVATDGAGTLVCCGQEMELLVPNTVDAAFEKHVPVVTIEDGKIKVEVGSVPHPMIAEHFIEWICAAYGNRVNRYILKPGDAPAATFCVKDTSDLEVYAYCNLHGLWKA